MHGIFSFSNGKLASRHHALRKGQRFPAYSGILSILIQLVSVYTADVQPVARNQAPNKGDGTELVCPLPNHRPETPETLLLNLLPCTKSQDCPLHEDLGILCCKTDDKKHGRCRYGMIPPKPKPTHLPFLGLERHCPEKDSLTELFPVKNCTNDNNCWPRICCEGYCRTPDIPKIIPRDSGYTTLTTLRYAAEYLQCTPPPRYDLFRKTCLSMRDCFPMVCCQERGVKVCRPGKKSILPLLATLVKDAAEG